MHIHVRKAGGFAKFWIDPVELDFSQGMKIDEIRKGLTSCLTFSTGSAENFRYVFSRYVYFAICL